MIDKKLIMINENKKGRTKLFFLLLDTLKWGGRRGSNPRHSVPQTDALTN